MFKNYQIYDNYENNVSNNNFVLMHIAKVST